MNTTAAERDDQWFQELIKPLRARPDHVHPSRAILRVYLQGQLPDAWRVEARSRDLNDWTLTEVSQHTLTCSECAQQLALMRQHKLEQSTMWRELWEGVPGALRAHCAIYAVALFALVVLNALLVTLVPAPVVSIPCGIAPETGWAARPFTVQIAERTLRTEGINKPVQLPPSLSKECVPVPAPRPLWQTWWVGWVFLIWTALLGLHILGEVLSSPVPRRTVATSALTLALIGSVAIIIVLG